MTGKGERGKADPAPPGRPAAAAERSEEPAGCRAEDERQAPREELRSTNEELSTLNGRLADRVRELEAANDDLANLLSSTDIPTVFLDRQLRIRRFTPASTALLAIRPSDVGRLFEDLPPRVGDPQFPIDAGRVLDDGESRQAEVHDRSGRSFIRKLLPYRTGGPAIAGVVLTLTEVTGLRRAMDQLGQLARQREAVVELGRLALTEATPERLFERAVALLGQHLDCRYAEVLELLPGGEALLLRGGVGWQDGLVGRARVPAGRESQAGYTLQSAIPVVVADLPREHRFAGPPLLVEHGVIAGISVVIGPETAPWGVLGVHDDRGRAFNSDDVGFVQSVANLLFVAIQRRSTVAELERSGQRLQLALDAARMGTWEWQLASGRVTLDARASRLVGLPPGAGPIALSHLAALLPAEELRAARRRLLEARRSGSLDWPELRVPRERPGGPRWLAVRGRTLGRDRREEGRMIGTVQDITAQKEEFQRREMLMAELDHRVKNILANVNAIARQTGRRHRDAGEFITTLEGRIRAMADSHSLLSASRWTGADLRTLLASELAPYSSQDSDHVAVTGPTLMLAPKAAQSFSLALHELATNAAKHGSLSRTDGRVSASWEVVETEAGTRVRFEWREAGGPAPAGNVSDGFGMTVLKRMVPKDLGGEAELALAPDGLAYRIHFPLDQVILADDEADVRTPWASLGAGEAGGHAEPARPAEELRSLKVLIVEDAWAVAEQLRTILELLGHQPVGPASSLAEGLALAELDGLDAAILDIRLDGDSVFPLAERLAERGLPFGFVSGYNDAPRIPAAFRDRPSISKPFADGNIRALIEQLVKN